MIIVGLGNPGKDYEQTRHNIGYMFLDKVAEANNVKFKLDKAFEAFVGELIINGQKHLLVKPTTFMNSSGNAVYKIMNYYNLDLSDLIVIHDDMDLVVGETRIRKSGGSGGHNGIKSIISCVDSQEFKRIRIGIGHPENDTIDFVLGKFNKEESKLVQDVMDKAPNIIDDLIINGIDYIMNHYNN